MTFLILSITAAPIFRFSFSVHLFKARLLKSSDWTALTKAGTTHYVPTSALP